MTLSLKWLGKQAERMPRKRNQLIQKKMHLKAENKWKTADRFSYSIVLMLHVLRGSCGLD